MLKDIVRKLFSSANEREIRRFQEVVKVINNLEKNYLTMSDDGLREQTNILKARLKAGETLDQILPQAFAVVREAAKRINGERAFDVQLIGAMVLHKGMIAEMKTGEGKTFVAVFAAYLNALEGKGVHVVTVNDYLAKVAVEWMGKIYNFLGLSVGCILQSMPDEERKKAYQCDITYGTNSEFGFDYLRDNLKINKEQLCQRDFNFAIVDEVDSILIDEARTPLIISGATDDNSKLYVDIDNVVKKVDDSLCSIDEKERTVVLTEEGTEVVEKMLKNLSIIDSNSSLYDLKNMNIVHHVNQALKAHKLFKNEVDYMVKDGEVLLVDEFTGRIMDGRRFSDGLHQALEAKEGVQIQNENQTLASITYQNYFRLYPKLSGMTGTAMTESVEFEYIYNLKVVEVPTNMPVIRKDEDDVIYKTEVEKYKAIVRQIKECYEKNQPVLVGTVSIEKSEKLSKLLKAEKLPHNVLNAKYHEKEAYIIAQAGKPKAITIATNMAGRGTDIKLGGTAEFEIKEIKNNESLSDDEKRAEIDRLENEIKDNRDIVIEAGGLFVLGTERHESRRIDNQLRGRSGRQGDVGVSKFFISLEDDLMRIFGSDKLSTMLTKLGLKDDEAIVHPWISKSLEKAQKKVENIHYEMRKNVLKYDDVVNTQRKVVFEQRRDIMFADSVDPEIKYMIKSKNDELVNFYMPNKSRDDWDVEGFISEVSRIYGNDFYLNEYITSNENVSKNDVLEKLQSSVDGMFKDKVDTYGEEVIRTMQKHVYLLTIDRFWKDHLYALDKLRQSIGLRAYGQKDPLLEYKKEGYNLFESLMYSINEEVIGVLAKSKISIESPIENQIQIKDNSDIRDNRQDFVDKINFLQKQKEGVLNSVGKQETITNRVKNDNFNPNDKSTWGRVGRNELCPCGSGKKYKHCHGEIK
ncbi:MAG: preprotein translocase subunit SecA [Rickettsiales bacterium]|nr:preprotein translocase subunit SecA [Rickettsiales bacterium]